MNIEEKLKDIIVICGNCVDRSLINEEIDLIKDLGYSSINIIQLVVELENLLDIEIDDEDLSMERLSPYKNLLSIIQVKVQNKTI